MSKTQPDTDEKPESTNEVENKDYDEDDNNIVDTIVKKCKVYDLINLNSPDSLSRSLNQKS